VFNRHSEFEEKPVTVAGFACVAVLRKPAKKSAAVAVLPGAAGVLLPRAGFILFYCVGTLLNENLK
jgi:hypothetical protein